tara:strand:- start:190 stop:1161 length:972 start_codon:yes stop_codon:yes gene_type:complete
MKLVVADLNNRGIYRPLDEIYGEYETNDTGLCNRLLCWELVKIINHIHDDKFEIVLDSRQNPETNNCFTLEDTTMVNTSDINFDDYLPISDIMVQDIIDGKLKLGDKNYYTDFSKRQINDFIENYSKRFIKSLKFKHNDINKDIKSVIQGSIGIHVRRGRGVKIHKDNTIDLSLFEGWNHDILSDYVKMKVKDMPAWKFYQFDFIKDEVYFEKIDLILKKLPKQKFYISHDLKDEYFERWVERYPNNIILKDSFYDLLSNWEIPLEVHTKNFLDLYCLCNTREIFKTPLSTWSDLACDYNNKIGVYLNWDSNQKILDKCIKFF